MKKLPIFSFFLFLSFLGAPSLVVAQEKDDFKVAGVDVQKVFQEFNKTLQTEERVNEERIRIQKIDQKFRQELKLAKGILEAEQEKEQSSALSEEELKMQTEKVKKMFGDYNQMNREREARYNASNKQLNQSMGQTMLGILAEIQRFIKAHAEEVGYDMVLDMSGTTTNQTSPVIGGKGIKDITAEVIAELNK